MEFVNHTNYPSLFFRTVITGDSHAASSIIRVTYDIEDGIATPNQSQEWKLYDNIWETEYGPMESDNVFRRGGVDIFVFGKAVAPGNIPIDRMDVTVKIKNKLSCKVAVFGDRIWEKNILGMYISSPKPFKEMPLTLYNAYGGIADWDGIKFPFANNAFGKGYYWERQDALNMPLPNIENPDQLINKWDDRPDPVGFVSWPMNGTRIKNNVVYDKDCKIKKIEAGLFNSAFPGMIVKEIETGENIVAEGFTSKGIFNFKVPEHSLHAKISVGEKVIEKKMIVDQIGIVPEKKQAFITYRLPFTYSFEPLQIRTCEVFEKK